MDQIINDSYKKKIYGGEQRKWKPRRSYSFYKVMGEV
jgi:hypothetical protein